MYFQHASFCPHLSCLSCFSLLLSKTSLGEDKTNEVDRIWDISTFCVPGHVLGVVESTGESTFGP